MDKLDKLFVMILFVGIIATVAYAGNRETAKLTVAGAGNTISTGVNAADLADSPRTSTMRTTDPVKTQIALGLIVASGTSTDVTITCEWTPDETNWFFHDDCAYDSAGNYDCVQASWSFAMSTSTNYKHTFLLPAFGVATRCTFDDAADGSGTISVVGYMTEF